MKISYKTLKRYIPDIENAEEIAQKLIMHTAEVEEIQYEWKNLEWVFVWEIIECKQHKNAEKLTLCVVNILWKEKQIICWANNVRPWLKVPVATIWTALSQDFIIKKTEIRWEISNWMICSEDELWLTEIRQKQIMELPDLTQLWMPIKDYLEKNDIILEIDNKAINHRPDLFSHIWIAREIQTIREKKLDFEYKKQDLSSLPDLWIKNHIPQKVKRYIWIKVNNVKNIKSPKYIKEVLNSFDTGSKWLLIDITNYCLYLYWQPTHCFDSDKIKWNIEIRFAKEWEYFLSLKDLEYKLSKTDIVIADSEKVLALWGVIWWKQSAISDNTKSIIIEAAHFNQATVRKTWKRLWIRTDSLNVFEKDIQPDMNYYWASLIIKELEKNLGKIELESYSDLYENKQKIVYIDFSLENINKLIWKNYTQEKALNILNNLWIKHNNWVLEIPFWRKDLTNIGDIAEEIARIDWYNKVKSTIPKINIWAVIQDNIYKLRKDSIDFFTNVWFFDTYTYSFVNKELMEKVWSNTDELVEMKNQLSEELTHLKPSLIPNLLLSLEKNKREFQKLRLFETEKIFTKKQNKINEQYSISGVISQNSPHSQPLSQREKGVEQRNVFYYDVQNIVSNFLKSLATDEFFFDIPDKIPSFAHLWRTASVIINWEKIWILWEISPKIVNNFNIKEKIWFFEINADLLSKYIYKIAKAKETSLFQENHFDLSFVVDKDLKWREIKKLIEDTDKVLIQKVELFDIFESSEKLPWKRSISFKIYIQSMEWTLDDKIKNELIEKIIKNIETKWWKLRDF